MKIICLKPNNQARVLVDTNEQPDYMDHYLQEDGTPFNVGLSPVPTPAKSANIIKKPVKRSGRPKKK